MHPVSCWHSQSGDVNGATNLGPTFDQRVIAGNGGRVDLRPGPGGAEPSPLCHEVFPQGGRVMSVTFTMNGQSVVARDDETLIQAAKRYGIEIPHLCYMEGMRADGNCRAC